MKAIALISGGLDSFLALYSMLQQGVEAVGVYFLTPVSKPERLDIQKSAIKNIMKKMGVKLKIKNMGVEYLQMIKVPKYGYGRNMNPCIDCKILMLKSAKRIMDEENAQFVVTGEVLGQRPMSQHRQALKIIERESGLSRILLRPLSAKLLEVTSPEEKGWVERDKLLSIDGRSRKIQIKLAQEAGIEGYSQPAGGCLLTDTNFSKKVNDLWKYNQYSIKDVHSLKVGRHFRISHDFKVIVGRNEKENDFLLKLAGRDDFIFEIKDYPSPLGLGRGKLDKQKAKIASEIIVSYSSLKIKARVTFGKVKDEQEETIYVNNINKGRLSKLMV